jgi:hypothetical protein
MSVTEALACGLPVLAAEGVGVFPNGNAKALAAMLVDVAFDPRSHDQRGKECHIFANNWHYKHSIEAFRASLLTC